MDQTINNQPIAIDSLDQVKEFMTLFKQPVYNSLVIPSETRIKFRLGLIVEESCEIARDCGATKSMISLFETNLAKMKEHLAKLEEEGKEEIPNPKGILDNMVDLRYVADGMVHEFGLGPVFRPAFNDVHSANIAKTCDTELDAQITVAKYQEEGIGTYYEFNKEKGRYLIYRTADKKALKSHLWKECDLSKYVQ